MYSDSLVTYDNWKYDILPISDAVIFEIDAVMG
jgi:hypothetical protein